MIPKETVDEIMETARVEEVVGDYVNLKKRGVNLLGLCPFHNEKTPSFTVSPTKGIYKCFGCGRAGGSVNFIMDHEQYSYPEALRYLATKYNIEIEEEEQTPEQLMQSNERESLFLVSQFASDYFQKQLHETDSGRAIGLSYFKERGFREDIIEKFNLGYCQDEWKAFTEAALDAKYQLDYLEKTGLTIVKEDRQFDRFKGRVIFPIHNISGRVIAFGGRTLSADKKTAKYVNSPESDIYHKSKVLYGLNQAKKQIIAEDRCYLVEGYTDVISFHQNGVENVVASSGTSLTVDQIRLIKRYTQNITILFDGDTAGIKAAFRGIDMILEEGLNVRVLAFPDGEDPDSFAKKHSNAELLEFLNKESVDFIRFKTSLLLKEVGDDPIKRAGLIKEIVESIALIPDPIARSVYLQECSQLMDIREQALLSELNKIRRKKISKKIQKQANTEEFSEVDQLEIEKQEKSVAEPNYQHQEKDIIRTLIKYGQEDISIVTEVEVEKQEEEDPDSEPELVEETIETTVAEYMVYEIERDHLSFNNPLYATIYTLFKDAIETESGLEETQLVSHENQQISSLVIECLMEKYALSFNWEERHKILTLTEDQVLPQKVQKGVCSWRLSKVLDMINERQQKLKENDDDYESTLNELIRLNEAKMRLAHELGRIILR